MTFDFLLVRLTGAGVPITTGLKRSCSEHARFREKILQALWGEDDFFHEPEGLALLVREEHELPLPVVMGTQPRYDFSFEVCLCGEIMAFLFGLFRKKCSLCK